jgi:hypothetical protein
MMRIMTKTAKARAMLPGLPKFSALGSPPAQVTATGKRETPIMVMMDPVTTGGKKRSRREKYGLTKKVMIPATITDPYMAVSPAACPIRIIGVTAAKVTPWMIGSRKPTFQKPTVWIRVATPQVKRSASMR